MSDGSPLRAPAKTAVRDEGHLSAQSHANDGRGWGEHLLHPGAPLGPLVTNHYHIPGSDLSAQNGFRRRRFTLEDPSPPRAAHHFGGHRRLFDDRAIRSQVAPQDGDSPFPVIRVVKPSDDFVIKDPDRAQILSDRPARDGPHVLVDDASTGELLHDSLNPPGGVQILQKMGPTRSQAAQVRRALTHRIEQVKVQIDARLGGDGRNVKHRVCRATECHVNGHGIFKGFPGGDVPRPNPLSHELHDLHAAQLGKTDARGRHRRQSPVPREPHPEGLREAVHGIRREHAGTRSATGTRVVFEVEELPRGDLTGLVSSHALEDRDEIHLTMAHPTGEHGPAAHHDGGNVETHGSHEHPGDDLVAIGNQDQPVKGVSHGHDFNRIGDEFPAGKGVAHAGMIHGDAVTHPNGTEFDGCPPGVTNPGLDGLGDLVQMDVAGNDLIGRVGHPDEGAVQFGLGVTHGLEKRSVWGFFNALFHGITAHLGSPQRGHRSGAWVETWDGSWLFCGPVVQFNSIDGGKREVFSIGSRRKTIDNS